MSSTGGNRTCKQRWVLFPSSLQKVLLPHPLWYLPITTTGAWHRSLFFHTACLHTAYLSTQILPHHSAATQDSHINPHRTGLGVALPTPSLQPQQVISFSFWLPLAMSLFTVKAHVIPRRKGHAEARNPQADRQGR